MHWQGGNAPNKGYRNKLVFRLRALFRSIGLALICLIIGFVAGFFSYTPFVTWRSREQYQARQDRFLHQRAPQVVSETVNGTAWSLHEHRGKIVLMNFWATWCAPCVQELPELRELHNKYKDGADFLLVGIALDKERNTLTRFCEERRIEWLQLHEADKAWSNSVARAFDVQGIPSVWLIDRDGSIVVFETTLSEIEIRLSELLKNPEPRLSKHFDQRF